MKIKELIETLSPILINPKPTSITVSLSRRFFIFDILNQLKNKIEDDPYLNFISILKFYKVLGKFLHGTIYELHRDRNKLYFKNFFLDQRLYKLVKADLEWVYKKNKNLKVTITKRGVIIYDNYKKNNFNVLLLTIHSGIWMPANIEKKQILSEQERLLEEDIDTHKLYSDLVLNKSGIWIDNKFSRFACDFNRKPERAIYQNESEKWIKELWKEPLTERERSELLEGYYEFYFTIGQLIDTYRFNIIFDGHSMKDAPGRPQLSFGTRCIPKFYLPIVKSMQRKLSTAGYHPVALNVPYGGGYILRWLSQKFPDIFICSMEINKTLYMSKNRKKSFEGKIRKVSADIAKVLDIDEEVADAK